MTSACCASLSGDLMNPVLVWHSPVPQCNVHSPVLPVAGGGTYSSARYCCRGCRLQRPRFCHIKSICSTEHTGRVSCTPRSCVPCFACIYFPSFCRLSILLSHPICICCCLFFPSLSLSPFAACRSYRSHLPHPNHCFCAFPFL